MGEYTIVISGHGANGNGTERDADEMGAKLVQSLKDAGHQDVRGAFLYGFMGVPAEGASISLSGTISKRL